MQGKIALINARTGIVAAHTANGFTIFSVQEDAPVKLHDVISGELEALGEGIFTNETQGGLLQVMVQDIHASLLKAKRLLGA